MKPLFIIANWKAHKTVQETKEWLQEISNFSPSGDRQFPISNDQEKNVIICPPFHLLELVRQEIESKQLPFLLGSQDVSSLPVGSYTGEVTAIQLKELVTYVIIGHSERRKYLHETDEMLFQKVEKAHEAGLKVIYCVRGEEDPIPPQVELVAFEPVTAIGSGHADTPEDANQVTQHIQEKNPQVQTVIYGGSVTGENVNGFTSQVHISGVLVGTDSLDPQKFTAIINNS